MCGEEICSKGFKKSNLMSKKNRVADLGSKLIQISKKNLKKIQQH